MKTPLVLPSEAHRIEERGRSESASLSPDYGSGTALNGLHELTLKPFKCPMKRALLISLLWASGRAGLRIQKSSFKSLLWNSPYSAPSEGFTGSWEGKDDSLRASIKLQREFLLAVLLSAKMTSKDSSHSCERMPRFASRVGARFPSLESGLACEFLWPRQCGRVMRKFWNLVLKWPENVYVRFLSIRLPCKKAQTRFLNDSQVNKSHDSNDTWNRDKTPPPNFAETTVLWASAWVLF